MVVSVLLLFLGFILDFLSDIWSRQAEQLPYVAREVRGTRAVIHDENAIPTRPTLTKAPAGHP